MAKANLALNTGIAAALGGLDGVASSRDASMGRSWNSPGVAAGFAPVIGWGWAPVVQLGSLAIGGAAAATGRSWGTAAMCAGAATFTRAAAFRLMQNRPGAHVVRTQGMSARAWRPGDRPIDPDGTYDNSWDPTSSSQDPRRDAGNAYIGGPIDATTRAPGDSPGNGMLARGWTGTPGVYGDPRNSRVQHGQASGLL